MNRFADKVVLITGAAAGIGRATALRIAREGGSLFLTDIAAEGLEETGKLVSAEGGNVETHAANISLEDDVSGLMAACIDRYGRLDALCNIAGRLLFEHFTDISFEDWRKVMSVNVDGTFLMSRAALPHLLETKGCIVNVGSTAGLMGLPYGAAYSASKGAVHALTRAIAVEYTKRGVRANAICPASIETAMMQPSFPEGVDMRLMRRPASLHGTRGPEVCANLIAYLASDEAEHISGEEIRIDGAALA
jgi:NAD(P)-dependent dehydrogenase (short-subunit alcohol dehydrogenase family)